LTPGTFNWYFLIFFENGLCIIPNVNLVSNIGFGSDATHTVSPHNTWANIPPGEITEIKHPLSFTPEKQADINTLKDETDMIVNKRNQKWHRRFKRWFKSLFK